MLGRAVARILVVLAVAIATQLCGLPSAFAADPPFPALTGRVVDAANILPADSRGRIEAKLKAYEDKTSDQLVVATVPSLGDLTVEDYANKLFRSWGIGRKDKNNGVLLLIAPKEHKMRIETGYGAEGALTDAASSTIINTIIGPKFRKGDFGGAVEAGVDEMIAILGSDAAASGRQGSPGSASSPGGIDRHSIFGEIFPTLVWVVALVFIFWPRRNQTGARHHRSSGGRWNETSGSGGGLGSFFGGISLGSSSGGWSSGSSGGGGFSGGGGSSGGGGASGSW
jgi:uncharacterized protein